VFAAHRDVYLFSVIGNCVGSLVAGPASDKWGRRGGMFIGGFFILLGSAIITASQNSSYFLAGRVRLSFFACRLYTTTDSSNLRTSAYM
jgi:MFS family permease